MSIHRPPRPAAALLASLLAASFAQAQEAAPTLKLEPVTVSGEKIARDLQNTTSSVGVVNAERIEQTGVRSLPEAFRLLGNLRDADFVDSGILIRGINSEGVGGPAGRPLASVYVDGVAQTDQGVRRGALGLWDTEQVEVLRGPQSTISGRNALAGAIRVQTKDPSFAWEAAAQLRAGNQDLLGGAFMLSGPIAEDYAFRLAGDTSHSRGFVDYPFYDGLPRLDERRNDDYRQLRGKLLWQPQGSNGPRVLLSHSGAYDSPSYDDVDGPVAGVDWFDRSWGAQSLPVFVEARSSRNDSTAIDVSLPLGTDWRITSLTTRVESRTDRPSVDEASVGRITQTEVAQELRANYDRGPLRAVAGLYFNRETADDDRDQVRPFDPDVLRADRRDSKVRNSALFGEVNWTTGAWTWIAGARYDHESQDSSELAERRNGASGALLSSFASTTDASYDAFLPKLGVTYALGRRQQIGLVAQRGYRAGGAAVDQLTGEVYGYDPEVADNFELSWRWQSADQRWRVNANLFQMNWKDQQVNVPQVPGDFSSDLIVNAGRSRIRGGELELQARPAAGLDVFASLGLAKTEFRDFQFVQFGAPLDLRGEAFPQAPDFTGALGAHYRLGGWFVGGDLKYTGSALSRSLFEGLPADRMPSYTVLNLRTGYAWKQLRVSAFVDNATDEQYFLYRYDQPEAFQVSTVGRGRTFGAVVDLSF